MTGLGVMSAGGRSTRYGSPKALAEIGGIRVADRVAAVLGAVVGNEAVRCIANDPELGKTIGLPFRGDVLRDAGALAGVHAALVWAREEARPGALVTGCDMPFLDTGLLRALIARAGEADVVVPASTGPRGIEPLCAWYGTGCITAIESAVAGGDVRMIGFHERVQVHTIGLDEVRRFGDPERLFLNVNTEADRRVAERWAREL